METYTEDDLTVEMAKDMLACQSAPNCGALIHSLSEHVKVIQDKAFKSGKGHDWIAQHPLITMFLTQIAFLNKGLRDSRYSEAYALAQAVLHRPTS